MSNLNKRLGISALIMATGTFAGRILGLLREVFFAAVFGNSPVFAAFTIAFAIPNMFRAFFAEGAFSNAFIPTLSEVESRESKKAAWKVACNIITILIATVSALAVIGMVIVHFTGFPAKTELQPYLQVQLPLILPYAILICATAGFGAFLNFIGKFSYFSLISCILNLCFIGGCGVIHFSGGTSQDSSKILILTVLIAGILQLLFMLFGCYRHGYKFKPSFNLHSPAVKKVTTLMLPMLVGAGVLQISSLMDKMFSAHLGAVATTSLHYSNRLVLLPVGAFGVAMATVCLPRISKSCMQKNHAEAGEALLYGLQMVLFLSLPVTAVLLTMGDTVISLLFMHGKFNENSLREAMLALLFYAPGIPAFACAKVANTPYYANHDTRTPVRFSLICLVLNFILNLTLMQFLRQGGLALATTISSTINICLLLINLNKVNIRIPVKDFFISLLTKFLPATLITALVIAGCKHFLPEAHNFIKLCLNFGIQLAAGGITYLVLAYLFKIKQLTELVNALRRR